jgi:hypothetical protein
MRAIKPFYAARAKDIQPGEFLKVERGKCLHVELIPPVGLRDGLRLPPLTLVQDLQPRFRCLECDSKDGARVGEVGGTALTARRLGSTARCGR